MTLTNEDYQKLQNLRRENNEKQRSHYLTLFKDNIIKNKNFTFTKYGDGEMYCMMGEEYWGPRKCNCDAHPYSTELGDLIRRSLLRNVDRDYVYLGDWTGYQGDTSSQYRDEILKNKYPNYVLYEILMNHQGEPNPLLYEFIKEIKLSNRKKIFVGPAKLEKVNDLINSNTQIKVPPNNTFSEYERIKAECLHNIKEDCIFIFSCGMPSKVLIDDILSVEEKLTCLDFGSGFDNIILDWHTRDGQTNLSVMKKFYETLLTR